MITANRVAPARYKRRNRWAKNFADHWELYLIILIPLALLFIFYYYPMYGAQIAFKDFKIRKGIVGSDWAGVKHFEKFFGAYDFWPIILNTLTISLTSLLIGFPMPIILAISINECRRSGIKKAVQMSTYAPYFISTVVLVSMMNIVLANEGLVNKVLDMIGFGKVNFLGDAGIFKFVYAISGTWQSAGYGAIIYIAALSGVDPQQHEAALIDGANKWQRIYHVDFPAIIPTAVLLMIMNLGQVMNVGFEKAFLMQNPMNMSQSNVISTYVYRIGLINNQPDYATAVGLFNSVVGLSLTVAANYTARHVSGHSLW